MVNLISVDIAFLQKALRFLHLPWACPLQLALSVAFLYSILGVSIVPGQIFMHSEEIARSGPHVVTKQ